jgi:hypothetical protein|tara:strand:- start:173 stop:433 length:261 start_codon:yes stop_codon:yes gene_type:complete
LEKVAIKDYYLNGLKTLNEPVKIVDPEWNAWLSENQHLFRPMGLMEVLDYIPISPAHPQKQNRFILKGWSAKLRVLGWIYYLFYDR